MSSTPKVWSQIGYCGPLLTREVSNRPVRGHVLADGERDRGSRNVNLGVNASIRNAAQEARDNREGRRNHNLETWLVYRDIHTRTSDTTLAAQWGKQLVRACSACPTTELSRARWMSMPDLGTQ